MRVGEPCRASVVKARQCACLERGGGGLVARHRTCRMAGNWLVQPLDPFGWVEPPVAQLDQPLGCVSDAGRREGRRRECSASVRRGTETSRRWWSGCSAGRCLCRATSRSGLLSPAGGVPSPSLRFFRVGCLALSTGCFLFRVGFVLGRFIHRPAVHTTCSLITCSLLYECEGVSAEEWTGGEGVSAEDLGYW